MDERRKNDRIDPHGTEIRVLDSIDREPLGIIGNLSPGGMMLITSQQLFTDGILQLTLETPPGLDCPPIALGVKILWCTPANSPNEYWAGLETIDIDPANSEALKRLLSRLHLSH